MAKHSRKAVEEALAAEASQLDSLHQGTHRFDPIQQKPGSRCNWTATFVMIGSRLPLATMHDVLERVQARMPIVDFGRE